jgi:hypothetical protein
VVQLYRIVAGILSTRFANLARLGDRLFLMQFPNFAQMLMAINTFTVEVLLNLACGELKLRNIDGFLSAYDEVERILSQTGVGCVKYTALAPGLVDRRKSCILYKSLYGPCPPSWALLGLTPCTQAETYEQFLANGASLGALMAYDYEIVSRHPDQEAIFSAEHLPLDQCAAVCLPFTTSFFYKTVEGAMQKGHFEGWHDVEFLSALPSGLKEDIRAWQRRYGLQMADFTQL